MWVRNEEQVAGMDGRREGTRMFWTRRGNTRFGCVVVPCGCLVSPLLLVPGAVLAYELRRRGFGG